MVKSLIDIPARRRLSGLMRRFATGRITNDEFDAAYEDIRTGDRDARRVADSTFAYFNEFRTVRLTGKYRLSRSERGQVARWLLFLQSRLPYANVQPPFRVRLRAFLNELTHGLVPKSPEAEQDEHYRAAVWPFATEADLEEARRRPKLLCGLR